MKYDNLKAFEKHLESAAPHHFSNLYLILGKEPSECEEAVRLLMHALLSEKEREHASKKVEGALATIDSLLTELNSISFLTPKRVIEIQHADKLKKPVQDALEQYISQPQRSHYLILTATSLHKSSTFYKKIEKAGIVLELPEIKAWEKEKRLIDWVSKQASLARKIISHQACRCLVKYVGCDQVLLANELEKLLCYIEDRKEITIQDIDAICTHLNTETVWQLGEAILCRDGAMALQACRALLDDGGSALLPLLRQIRSQLQNGYQISLILAHGGGANEVAQEFPYMKGQILDRHVHLAQTYGIQKFKQGLLTIDKAELEARNSQIEEDLLAELTILKLIS